MKLLKEEIEHIDYITEESNGKKSLYITGPFLVGECVNKNGRFYPIGLLDREVERYTKECIKENRAMGELSHPNTPTVNLDRVAIIIKELNRQGSSYIGKAKITEETPMGRIAKALIDENVKLGVSSRGVGSLEPHKDGYQLVKNDFRLCVAADLVSDPSAPNAFVSAVMENCEWLYDPTTGTWVEQRLEEIKKEVHTLTKEQREENALRFFKEHLSNLARK